MTNIYFEHVPEHYIGEFPSITVKLKDSQRWMEHEIEYTLQRGLNSANIVCAKCHKDMDTEDNQGKIFVHPCKKCLRNAIEDAREDGFSDGYAMRSEDDDGHMA